jgi:hypothetical protein
MKDVIVCLKKPFSLFALLFLLNITLNISIAYAQAPALTTFQARIVKPDGTPLESSNVTFTKSS